jgi:hypothetical protein
MQWEVDLEVEDFGLKAATKKAESLLTLPSSLTIEYRFSF